MGALDDIHILDFTQVIFGPTCTQVLAHHGADVIKIERPGQGDLARGFGVSLQGESLAYASLNLSKRSIVLNLKTSEGMAIIHRLLAKADVLVHNFRPGVMARLGLDYPTLEPQYPRLVYAIGSGYGTRGPYADRGKAGHQAEAEALAGLVVNHQGSDGLPEALGIADNTGGLLLAQGVLLALFVRERTGRGQAVETSLLDGLMAMQAWKTSALLNAPSPAEGRTDADSREGAVANADAWQGDVGGPHLTGRNPLDGAVFRTSNGYLIVSAIFRPHPEPLRNLCTALGIQDLSTDSRFATMADLTSNAVSLRSELDPVFASHTTAEWVRQLEAHDILCAPIRSTAEAFQDPQLAVNALLVEVEHSRLGKLRFIGTPVRLSSTPARPAQAAPMMGEHTDEILREVEYSAAEIADFCAGGIVA